MEAIITYLLTFLRALFGKKSPLPPLPPPCAGTVVEVDGKRYTLTTESPRINVYYADAFKRICLDKDVVFFQWDEGFFVEGFDDDENMLEVVAQEVVA